MRAVLFASGLCVVACQTTTAEVHDEPLSVAENQNGTTGGEGPAAPSRSGLPALPDTYIWCSDSTGEACVRATEALGAIAIKHPESAPPQLFTLEDTYDDCHATGMDERLRRLEGALGLDPSSWGDQSGSALPADQFPSVYSASGCISNAGYGPAVKVAASSDGDPRTYLVRIWESGSAYY